MLALLLCTLATDAGRPPSSLEKLGAAIDVELAQAEAPIALFVEGSPPPLSRAVASLLAARLADRHLAPVALSSTTATAAEAEARDKDARTLLRVSISIEAGHLVARGDVISTRVNFWSGRVPTRSGPATAIAVSVDADSAAVLMATTAATSEPVKVPTGPFQLVFGSFAKLSAAPLAIATGDLTGDRRVELAVLTSSELTVFNTDGSVLARRDLSACAPNPRPSRDPIGALALNGALISWLSSNCARGEAVTFDARGFGTASAIDALTTDGVQQKLIPGLNSFSPDLKSGVTLPLPATTLSTRGRLTLAVAPDSTATLIRDGSVRGRPRGLGASALLDLDGDGTVEAVVSSARLSVDGDTLAAIGIATLEAVKDVSNASSLWKGSIPRGRALVLTGGDADADGADELWIGAALPDGTGEVHLGRRVKQ